MEKEQNLESRDWWHLGVDARAESDCVRVGIFVVFVCDLRVLVGVAL